MKIIRKIEEIRKYSIKNKSEGKKIGFVPTMGALHDGHLSLIEKSLSLSDITIVSIFVNPLQFGVNEDFDSYPRNLETDKEILSNFNIDVLFLPEINEFVGPDFSTIVNVGEIVKKFEGVSRPQFFLGVATIVSKLFLATLPDYAFFGQKDYQQSLVVRKLSKDLNFLTEIIVSPIIRESNGLAMSSRNDYLTKNERDLAGVIFSAIDNTKTFINKGENNRKRINSLLHTRLRNVEEIKIDYACAATADELEEPEYFDEGENIVLLVAVYIGKVRLIDNSIVRLPIKAFNQNTEFKEGL